MRLRIVRSLIMAPGTERVALAPKPKGMRIVTVVATNARQVHAALQKRAPDIDLIANLPVLELKSWIEQSRTVSIEKCRPDCGRIHDLVSA